MSRRRSAHGPKLPAVEDVLRGHASVSVRQLFLLIHEINPTSRELPERTRRERYAVKAKLTAILLERFLDHLEIIPDTSDPDVVMIRARAQPDDVTHAKVPELDDAARARIRYRLDTAAAPGDPEPEPAPAARTRDDDDDDDDGDDPPRASDGDLLAQGRAALAEYDFDRAERCFRAALHASPNDPERAIALLELYIDHLGRDADALAVIVGDDAARDGTVRSLLALAAAHTALREARTDDARRELVELRVRSPAHPELAALTAELTRLRSAERRPLEEELARALAADDRALAEQTARALLEKWPESEPARRALAALLEERTRAELADLRRRAEARIVDGDWSGASLHLREEKLLRARAKTAADPELDRLLQDVELELRKDAERSKIEALTAALAGPDRPRALLAYCELDTSGRSAARKNSRLKALDHLETLGAAGSSAHARASVAAVLALERAERAFAEGNTAAAQAELAAHEKLLGTLAEARELAAASKRLERERRRAEALAALQAARDAAAASDHDRTAQRLASIDDGVLEASEAAEARELRRRAERRIALAQHARAVESLAAAGSFLEARDELDRAIALADPHELDAWRVRRDALSADLARAWHLRVLDCTQPEAPAVGANDIVLEMIEEEPIACLSPERGEVTWVVAHGAWLFVRVLDERTAQTRIAIALRVPQPFNLFTSRIDGDRLWVTGEGGNMLALDRRTWELAAYHDLTKWTEPPELIEGAELVPGGRFAFLRAEVRAMYRIHNRLIDLDRRRLHREMSEGLMQFVPLAPSSEARAALLGRERGVTLIGGNGAPIAGGSNDAAGPRGLAIHPSGRGFVLLASPVEVDDDHNTPLAIRQLDADGKIGPPHVIGDGACEELQRTAATSLDEERFFVLFYPETGEEATTLHAYSASGADFTREYQLKLPRGTTLATDPERRIVSLVAPTATGVRFVRLGRAEPEIEALPPVLLPSRLMPGMCGKPQGRRNASRLALVSALEARPQYDRERWLQAHLHNVRDDIEGLIDAVYAFRDQREAADAQALERARVIAPRHPDVVLLDAHAAAMDDDWPQVAALFSAGELDPEATVSAQHFHHLRGVARLEAGDFEGAIADLEKADELADLEWYDCKVVPHLELAYARLGVNDPDPRIVAHLARIREAEAKLASGHPREAAVILDDASVWSSRDLNAAALRAEAFLAIDATDDATWFAKTIALSRFVDSALHGFAKSSCPRIAPEKLEPLVARARAWLDAL